MSESTKRRVVSLLPSATEIVSLLGCESWLVGVSHECDFPDSVRALPSLTSSRLVDSGTSRGIDLDVRRLVGDVLSIYKVCAEALEKAKPDVVITQDLCEVCAVSLDDVRSAVAQLSNKTDVEIVTVSPTRLSHVVEDVRRIAAALGLAQQGEACAQDLLHRVHKIGQRANQATSRPRVVSIEWLDPIMLGGTWMPDLIELAGGLAVGAVAGGPAPTVSYQELAELKPDVVLLKPCGFSLERALQEKDLIVAVKEAVGPKAHVFLADGNAYFNRSGPRLVESLEILAACVHPTLFHEFRLEHQAAFLEI